MIIIHIFRNREKAIHSFSVRGHAYTAQKGQDIVCAGISAITQTAILGIGQYAGRISEGTHAPGNLSWLLKGEPDENTQAIMETMVLGLQEIAQLYPNSIKIINSRR